MESDALGPLGLRARRVDLEMDCARGELTMRAMVRSDNAPVTALEGWLVSGSRRVARFDVAPVTIGSTPTEVVAVPSPIVPLADACARCGWDVSIEIVVTGPPRAFPEDAYAQTPVEPLACVR